VAADIVIKVGEEIVVDQKDARFPLKATAVQGFLLNDVPQWLAGAKVGETRTGTFKIGDEAEREDLRGKDAGASFTLNDLRRAGPISDDELLKAVGYESMDALKASLKRQLDAQADLEFRRAQEGAIQDWLLEHAPFELPEDLAKRHANQLLRRTLVNLQYRGVPVEEIEKRLADIQSASAARALKDLKLTFILDKIAAKEKIEAIDPEVDARLKFIAAQYNRKEDRVREEMEHQGTLDSLRGQIREDKVMRMLLEKAKVAGEPEKPAEPQTT
jgi:trigger factor